MVVILNWHTGTAYISVLDTHKTNKPAMDFVIPQTTSVADVDRSSTAHIPRNRLRSNSGQEAFSSILAFDARQHSSKSSKSRVRRRANTTNSLFSLGSTMETTPTHMTLTCIAHVVFRHLTTTATWLRERPTEQRLPKKWMVFDDSARTWSKKQRAGGISVFRDRDRDRDPDARTSFSSTEDDTRSSFDFDLKT